ncbi:MAG TPA: N-acetylmuramoyl-L-alanine amidase-like domain-containing protein [Phycisphaerae bacterium]|nr:N-acetylmuramoyl-L-alanine amidase-like domain-containing protein [Phycisphaerae bacterium]
MAYRRVFLAFFLMAGGACSSSPSIHQSHSSEIRIHELDEKRLDAYLCRLAREEPDYRKRVALVARTTIGQPYRLGPLGEYPFELYDPDPLYCLTAGDCVTFVEQTIAMALAHDWPSFFQTLQRLRYKDGRIGMLSRNHFTETDWNLNNAWLLEDVTKKLPGAAAYRVRVDRAAFFKQFGLAYSADPIDFEDAHVPRRYFPEVLPLLQDADVVEFVRADKGQLYVGHLGFVFHNASAAPTLLHATKPAVREEPLAEYLARHDNVAGIKVLRLRSEKSVTP